jgi:serine protease Do
MHDNVVKEANSMVKRLIFAVVSVMLIISILALGACSSAPTTSPPDTGQNAGAMPINPEWTPPQILQQPALPAISDVVSKVKPSVVAINVEIVSYDIFNQPSKIEGAGSGWIIDEAGYIVTNNHVVANADSVMVTLEDGSKFSAQSVRTDSLTDLAVIEIDAQNLPALDIGDSSALEIGDWLVAIGNALGMGISATSGIVSALDVSLAESSDQILHGLIQTNAAINPGNSGGPLVNMAGEVIGINSIKIAEVGVEGMGYAISIDEAMPIIEKLITVGYIIRPWLGVGTTTVNQMVASWYNLSVNTGALVTDVTSGSPAEAAGLEPGDVITAIDGKEVASAGELVQLINSYQIGQEIEITFWRGQAKDNVSLTLAESPPPQS